MSDNVVAFGLAGTAMSAAGAGLSVTEIQAIVSIVITVLGFIISVLIPLGIKLYQKIKDAKADGKITKEEVTDIISVGEEIKNETESFVKEVSRKEKEKK